MISCHLKTAHNPNSTITINDKIIYCVNLINPKHELNDNVTRKYTKNLSVVKVPQMVYNMIKYNKTIPRDKVNEVVECSSNVGKPQH